MGGDDSQKLLPWREIYSSPGRKPPAQFTKSHSNVKAICSGVFHPPGVRATIGELSKVRAITAASREIGRLTCPVTAMG